MKIVSWNVNGIRATLGKGLAEKMDALEADILCFQEVKARPEQVSDLWLASWPHTLWNPAQKPGYSGVLILSRVEPLSTSTGIGCPEHDTEGRVATMEFEEFYLVNCYTPNSQNELARLPYRQEWDAAFRAYVAGLAEKKPVIFCGDLNVAHEEIDLARPAANHFSAGFSDEERAGFTTIGPHRDDFELRIGGMTAAEFASEGQQRTLAIALQMAQGSLLQEETGKAPILLIDDIFGELDTRRRQALLVHRFRPKNPKPLKK